MEPPANAAVVRHATRVLSNVGVTALRDTDGGHRQEPNAHLSGVWRDRPIIVYVSRAPVARGTPEGGDDEPRIVATGVIAGTRVQTVVPQHSALRFAVFARGQHVWQVTVTRPNRVFSDQPNTHRLVRALITER